jgi:hypothetical protein
LSSKWRAFVSWSSTALCDKLVAQIDEGRSPVAPKFEIEQSTIERQSLFDIADLECYMVETNDARFLASSMALSCCSANEERRGAD